MIKKLHSVLLLLSVLPLPFLSCVGNFCSSVGCLHPHYTCPWCFVILQFWLSFHPLPSSVWSSMCPSWRLIPTWCLFSVLSVMLSFLSFVFAFQCSWTFSWELWNCALSSSLLSHRGGSRNTAQGERGLDLQCCNLRKYSESVKWWRCLGIRKSLSLHVVCNKMRGIHPMKS